MPYKMQHFLNWNILQTVDTDYENIDGKMSKKYF